MKVTAAVATGRGKPLAVKELDLEEPGPGEVQVRMVATGICHTDALVRDEVYPTPMPVVLGHEGAGVVEKVGPGVTTVEPGDHVLLSFSTCGTCASCANGHPSYCTQFFGLNFSGRRADGTTAFSDHGQPIGSHFFGQSSFSSVSNVVECSVVKVPPTAPLELLGPLGCSVPTGAGAVLNVLDPEAGSSFVVFGTGAVGMSALLAARVANCSPIIAVDIVDSRLELAKELGATHVINSRGENVVERIKEITNGGVDYAVDATGNREVFRSMVDSLGSRGHAALVGLAAPGTEAAIDIGLTILTGAKISMVIEGDMVPHTFIPRLISLYQDGQFPFDRLIKSYPFAEINTAFEDSKSGATLKPVVVF
ncbi:MULTISPECIES: NAD(P)-dependent alcohol dehydrogenase [Streptomyces]|uniref:NAD(P)-dependent alcohol dehydrogenase n=1 Tax=Streptomyces gibsoniae TaxID=3075529 RepID=A0ABU2U1I4_9ACTN|nr:NAD(P)-dependent alcohol dehydrogenase [Streptomyces sp. DSM 41699]MDT0467090.1 NAD(P)-dependent alcohol dehydrogenase [Streptomyces sp. DSM 41699]